MDVDEVLSSPGVVFFFYVHNKTDAVCHSFSKGPSVGQLQQSLIHPLRCLKSSLAPCAAVGDLTPTQRTRLQDSTVMLIM